MNGHDGQLGLVEEEAGSVRRLVSMDSPFWVVELRGSSELQLFNANTSELRMIDDSSVDQMESREASARM